MTCQLIRVDFKKKKVKSKETLTDEDTKAKKEALRAWLGDLEEVLVGLMEDDTSVEEISVIVHDGNILIPACVSSEAVVESLEDVKQKFVKQMEEME